MGSFDGKRFFLAAFFFFLLIQAGSRPVNDGYAVSVVAQGIVDYQEWSYFPGHSPGYSVVGPDGKAYGKFGLGMSVLLVPAVWMSRVLSLGVEDPAVSASLQNLLWHTVPAFLGALSFFFLVRLGHRGLGLSLRSSVIGAIAAIVATPALIYFRQFYAEGMLAACGIGVLAYAAEGLRHSWRDRDLVWMGALASGAYLAKPTGALFVVIAGLAILLSSPRSWALLRRGSLLAVGLLPGMGLALAYNWTRTGSIVGTTYTDGIDQFGFSTPLLEGLWGLFLSPGKGVLWYAPIAVLGLVVWMKAWRDPLSWLVACCVVPVVGITATWWAWHGGECWGPRLLVPILPVLALYAFVYRGGLGARLRTLFIALGIAVQLLGVALPWHTYYERVPYKTWAEAMYEADSGAPVEVLGRDNLRPVHEEWRKSPIVGHAWLLTNLFEDSLEKSPWAGEFKKKDVDYRINWWVTFRANEINALSIVLSLLFALATAYLGYAGWKRLPSAVCLSYSDRFES